MNKSCVTYDLDGDPIQPDRVKLGSLTLTFANGRCDCQNPIAADDGWDQVDIGVLTLSLLTAVASWHQAGRVCPGVPFLRDFADLRKK